MLYLYKFISMKTIKVVSGSLLVALLALTSCKEKPKTEVIESVDVEQIGFSGQDGHNSQNSLDWNGVYKGVVPCADCSGIETSLTLNRDYTYVLSTLYQGKEDQAHIYKGKFDWDSSGAVIILDEHNAKQRYKVGEGYLLMLNTEGEIITGEMADLYRLTKQ